MNYIVTSMICEGTGCQDSCYSTFLDQFDNPCFKVVNCNTVCNGGFRPIIFYPEVFIFLVDHAPCHT